MVCLFGAAIGSSRVAGQSEVKAPERPAGAVTGQPKQGLATFDAAWKIIYQTHWDTNFNGVDWNGVRSELRPKAEAAGTIRELRAVIDEMLSRMGQSHMALIPGELADAFDPEKARKSDDAESGSDPKNESDSRSKESANAKKEGEESATAENENRPRDREGEAGFDVRAVDSRLVVVRVDPASPAESSGVRPGWIVQKVGQTALASRLSKLSSGIERRQAPFMAWRMATALLAGKPGSKVQIEFLNGENQPVTLEIERQRTQGEPVKLGLLPTFFARLEKRRFLTADGTRVGWIRFNVWMIPLAGALEKAVEEYRETDGIVIDLRGNLGGIGGMVMGVGGHFLKERASLGTMKMRGNEIRFLVNPRRVNQAGERVEPFGGPLAILVDGVSLSAAEIFAGGMQDIGRARVFGETSPGQALPAVWDRLPNGDVLYHAFADFVTASGVRLEGRGVIPDQLAPLNREELLAGRDGALQMAMAWISQQRAQPASPRSTGIQPIPGQLESVHQPKKSDSKEQR